LGQPRGQLARETGPSAARGHIQGRAGPRTAVGPRLPSDTVQDFIPAARGRTQGRAGARTSAGLYLLPGETAQDFMPGGSALSIAPPLAITQSAVPGVSLHSLLEGRRTRQRNTREANRATTRTWNDPDNPYGNWLRTHEIPGETSFTETFGYGPRDLMNRASGTSIPNFAPSNLPSRAPAALANRQGAPALPSYQPLSITSA